MSGPASASDPKGQVGLLGSPRGAPGVDPPFGPSHRRDTEVSREVTPKPPPAARASHLTVPITPTNLPICPAHFVKPSAPQCPSPVPATSTPSSLPDIQGPSKPRPPSPTPHHTPLQTHPLLSPFPVNKHWAPALVGGYTPLFHSPGLLHMHVPLQGPLFHFVFPGDSYTYVKAQSEDASSGSNARPCD